MSKCTRRLAREIMGSMPRIPDHDVPVADNFAVDPHIQYTRLVRRLSSDHTIIDFGTSVSHDPDIANRKRPVGKDVGDPVVRSGYDVVGFPGQGVFDAPLSFAGWISGALNF